MWIFLNSAFVSIVAHRDKPDVLCCRGRLAGDLQRAFRGHLKGRRVRHTPGADYAFRVELPRKLVQRVLAAQVAAIDYPNFKGSVRQADRESLYMRVWSVMKAEQDRRLGSSVRGPGLFDEGMPVHRYPDRDRARALIAGNQAPSRIPTRGPDGVLSCGFCEYDEAEGALLAQCSGCSAEQDLEAAMAEGPG